MIQIYVNVWLDCQIITLTEQFPYKEANVKKTQNIISWLNLDVSISYLPTLSNNSIGNDIC